MQAGRARRLARGVFTTDLTTDPARLVRDPFQVTAHFFPGAIIADRSVPLMRPDDRASSSDRPRRELLPFFDAYFSNFIEGTEFAVEAPSRA